MPRIFYTEVDIEDLARRGVKEIEVNDNVYITDEAREKMEKLGMRVRNVASPQAAPTGATPANSSASGTLTEREREQVIEKVKSGVIARLGPGVDPAVVDTIVRRVVSQL